MASLMPSGGLAPLIRPMHARPECSGPGAHVGPRGRLSSLSTSEALLHTSAQGCRCLSVADSTCRAPRLQFRSPVLLFPFCLLGPLVRPPLLFPYPLPVSGLFQLAAPCAVACSGALLGSASSAVRSACLRPCRHAALPSPELSLVPPTAVPCSALGLVTAMAKLGDMYQLVHRPTTSKHILSPDFTRPSVQETDARGQLETACRELLQAFAENLRPRKKGLWLCQSR